MAVFPRLIVGSIEGELILIGRNRKIRAIAKRSIKTSKREPTFQNADWIFMGAWEP
jgi:hypothetical protein